MKLSEALNIINEKLTLNETKEYFLVCGFTPLYLETFIKANLQKTETDKRIILNTGIFGSAIINLKKVPEASTIILFLEWSDFDNRLGFRSLCEWNLDIYNDILITVKKEISRYLNCLSLLQESSKIVVSLPILPIIPMDINSPLHEGEFSSSLREMIYDFSFCLSKFKSISVINFDKIRTTINGDIFDFKNELNYGFPYTLNASAKLAGIVSEIIFSKPSKKGLITDLDNTCWRGILGDDGLDGISWTLENKSQGYGLYQQLLKSLSNNGVLLGVSSKNNHESVLEALRLNEMILKENDIFPIEANWGNKSESIERILNAWNISASDVVFIDDNLFEIQEVKRKFPEIQCLHFPSDDTLVYPLLLEIRELFARKDIFKEDIIRSKSTINNSKLFGNLTNLNLDEEMLSTLNSTININQAPEFGQNRSLELINKTNQFNLNGRRFDLIEWKALGKDSKRIFLTFEYKDKYGPLGQISALSGVLNKDSIVIDVWVLSCRAFSRRIEYKIIESIFKIFNTNKIIFNAQETAKNSLVFDFFKKLNIQTENEISISEIDFLNFKPKLYIKEIIQ